ncbi:MAG: DALR domain-containing protein, partial [Thermotogota bacterium]|nr:DALR domain-containing protein [Thermotogota bacterium]
KMAKSVGNIISVRKALKKYGRDAVRMFLFSTQFRSPIDYSEEGFEDWKKAANRVTKSLAKIEELFDGVPPYLKRESQWVKDKRERFVEYLDDDFNTSKVLSMIFDMVKEINTTKDKERLTEAYWIIKGEFGDVLGLFTEIPSKKQQQSNSAFDDVMETLISLRAQLRSKKMYEQADFIRDSLSQKGIQLLDGPEGTKWQI